MTSRSNKNIEVEVRSFVPEARFRSLVNFFKKEGKFLGQDDQITYYFSGKSDLRIQKSKNSAKLWLKRGKIHDEAREEIEVKIDKKDFEKLEKLLLALGYEVEIKWFRKRNRFLWRGLKVTLDFTRGYGYIIELEKMSDETNKEKLYQRLLKELSGLKIEITPREEFDKKFKHYKANWRSLLN